MKFSLSIIMSLVLLALVSCSTDSVKQYEYESETLKIQKITDHVYVHISYLATKNFGNVACNGMIYINNGEAVIFDGWLHSIS